MNMHEILNGKSVFEVGGPSLLFNSWYPLFNGVSFLNLAESMKAYSPGYQGFRPPNTVDFFYGDASMQEAFDENNLTSKFDLVISSHTLEHLANPIKALMAWKTTLKSNGMIITIVPNKEMCWDRGREYTSFEHILEDYSNNTPESDMTHLHESSCMIENRSSYYSDVGTNNAARVIHHHVFSLDALSKCHEYCGFFTKGCFIAPDDKLQMIYIGAVQ